MRPERTFRQAATRYLNEATKTSLANDASQLKLLAPFIGDLALNQVHMGTLQAFIAARPKASRRAPSTMCLLFRARNKKHTLGCRLRAAGVSFEDRQDLLGHKSVRVTTHYSAAELGNLIEAANRMCGENSRKSPALVVLKRQAASGDPA